LTSELCQTVGDELVFHLEQLQQFGKSTWHLLILAKREKLGSNSLANQLGKNRHLAKLTSPRAYMRARIVVAIGVSL
jgi:hypothetical protein